MGIPVETTDLLPSSKVSTTPNDKTVSYQFNIEMFRFIAFVAICLVFFIAKILSDIFVFAPENEGDLVYGFITPSGTRDVQDTRIYELFGFNHTCNVVDFGVAKTFASIAIFFHILPMQIFLILSYFRNETAFLNDEITPLTYKFCKYTTVPCIVFSGLVYLWFVNSPEDSFVEHYYPYMLFQIALEIINVRQLWYYVDLGKVPLNVPVVVAKWYVRIFIILCSIAQVMVLAIINEHPILDSANNETHRIIFEILSFTVAFMTLITPTILSYWEWKKSGDTNSITFAHQ